MTTTTQSPDRRLLPARRFTSPELVDLRTAWSGERDLATRPGQQHHWCDDRHGWLLDAGLDAVLEPVLHAGAPASSFYRFTELDAPVAEPLLDRLEPQYLASERQNDGPTLGTVLRAVRAHPDRLRAHGYVVGPGRCDERITVEGVLVRLDDQVSTDAAHGPGCDCERVRQEAVDLGVDDAAVPAHEVTPWWGPVGRLSASATGQHWYRLWWD